MASFIRGGLVLALALGLGSLSAGCSSAHIKKADLGYEAFYSGDLEQAQEDFEAALNKVDDFEPALTGMGFIAFERGEYKEAKSYFDKAIATQRTADALWGRGRTQLKLYQWDGAAEDLKAASDATMDKANLELGIAHMLLGNPKDALSALSRFAKYEDTPERSLAGAQAAYRVGVKFDMPGKAAAIVETFSFEDGTPFAAEQARLMLDLGYMGADYPTAMRSVRAAGDSNDFGFEFRELSPVTKRSFMDYGGAVVDMVHIGSPAYEAGMRAGDILTGFRAMPIESAAQLRGYLGEFEAQSQQQESALVEVLRDNTYYALYLTLGDYDFDTPIRQARDEGIVQPVAVAADDMSVWPW